MNVQIKEIVDKLHDKNEFVVKLSILTDRSTATINRHWLGSEYNVPTKFFSHAIKTAHSLYKKQQRYIRNIEVEFEEIKP